MLEVKSTPSETSQVSDISNVTVPNSITANLDSESQQRLRIFIGLEINQFQTVLGASRPVPYVDTSVMRASDINKAVFGSITCRLFEVLGQCLICLKSLSVERGGKNFSIINACSSF